MEQPRILRSQSESDSGSSKARDENGVRLPLADPTIFRDPKPVYTPIVQTPDSKQWIDLDFVSPKLLREIRRRYDPAYRHDTGSHLGRSAARIKAWARHSKPGVDLQFRRTIGDAHDEIAELHVVPDSPIEGTGATSVPSLPAELSGTPDQIIGELADTSIALELDNAPPRSRPISGSDLEVDEPLPLYEHRQARCGRPISYGSIDAAGSWDGPFAPSQPVSPFSQSPSSWTSSGSSRPSSYQTGGLGSVHHTIVQAQDISPYSISPSAPTSSTSPRAGRQSPAPSYCTVEEVDNFGAQFANVPGATSFPRQPTRLSLITPPLQELPNTDIEDRIVHEHLTATTDKAEQRNSDDEPKPKSEDERLHALQTELNSVKQILNQEQSFPEILRSLSQVLRSENRESVDVTLASGSNVAGNEADGSVTKSEPSSPTREITNQRLRRKKSRITPRRKRSVIVSRKAVFSGTVSNDTSSEFDELPLSNSKTGLLVRRQTLPKLPEKGSDPEAKWAAVLRIQAKLLGAEHPLVYQARSDHAKGRANGHQTAELDALVQSRQIAIDNLGAVHPWVSSFSQGLDSLMRATSTDAESPADVLRKRLPRIETAPSSPRPLKTSSSQPSSAAGACSSCGFQQKSVSEPSSSVMINASPIEIPITVDRDVPSSIVPSPIEGGTTSSKIQSPGHQEESPSKEQNALMDLSSQQTSHGESANSLRNYSFPTNAPKSPKSTIGNLMVFGLANILVESIVWLREKYGPEPKIEHGKVRVRWTCSCGEQLYDDFTERQTGAARELEAYLNRPRAYTAGGSAPSTPSSAQSSRSFNGSSVGSPQSSVTSWSSVGSSDQNSTFTPGKMGQATSTVQIQSPHSPLYEPPWLLTCANEDRNTPKLTHLDMAPLKIHSDKDLAMSLRDHYFHVNKKWWRTFRLRGLTTIEFVQFEVHQNRFTDIRKCPDMPPIGGEYNFEPGDLLPPVGSNYLLHLFQHPEDYEGELIAYLRAPKKNGRLHQGVGWGINLVEGFLAGRVWLLITAFFTFGSTVFAIAWIAQGHGLQGAFAVSAWMVTLGALAVGWLQACLG